MSSEVAVPFFRSGFNYDRDAVSRETGLKCLDKSRASQADKDDADINVIVKRFGITGALPVSQRTPLPEGFYEEFDFRQSLDIVIAGEKVFNDQPADIRARFDNDPAKFLDFFTDPKNTDEAVKLGLAVPKPKAEDVVAVTEPKAK